MLFFDIHTHNIPVYPEQAIVSCSIGECAVWEDVQFASVGIHPWDLTEAVAIPWLERLAVAIKHRNVVAVGEVGLDKSKGGSFDLQTAVFRQEILLAEEVSLPVIIHCVRAFNELLQLKREISPQQSWVIHGFRGKAELAKMCLRHGCYLSFGSKFQEDSLRIVPLNRLLIETDEATDSIEEIYRRVAEVRGIPIEVLSESVWKNVREVFFKD